MVKLEKIEMNGFKSFVSSTEFTIGHGITAVVGPNGCGKSNIADAINWVIGERSSKTLRADHMGDVIFNGTENRRPQGMAEVSLLLSGAAHARPAALDAGPAGDGASTDGNGHGNGHGPAGAAGATGRQDGEQGSRPVPAAGDSGDDCSTRITRRLFRSGESEYLIDGRKCRLKDIQELLANLGVGTGVYAIIEQGKVDRVISTRPRDRRVLIEEAAGIALYKIRKRQAQSKMEATEANLSRINDIVSELERQINSLKRQAAKARRYARITEGIDRAEKILFHHESLRLEALGAELGERKGVAEGEESRAAAELGRAEARLQEARESAARESLKLQEAKEALHQLDRAIDTLKRSVERSREQEAAAEAQIERSHREVMEIRQRLRQGAERQEDLARRLARAQETASDVEAKVSDQEGALRLDGASLQADESALATAREDMVAAATSCSDARNQIQRLEERRAALAGEIERLQRDSAGIRQEAEELTGRRTRHAMGLREGEARLAHAAGEAEGAAVQRREEEARRERIVVEREQKRGLLEGIGERMAALREMEAPSGERDGGGPVPARLLKDLLAPPEHLDRAVDAALGGLLRGVVTETPDEALRHLRALKERGGGRAVVIPEGGRRAGAAWPRPIPPRGGLGILADLLGPRGSAIAGLRPRLERILVASDLQEALGLSAAARGFDVVTLQGDFLSSDGWMEGGAQLADEAGVMTLKRLMERLSAEAERTRAQIEDLEEACRGSEERLAALREREEEWRRRAGELSREVEALRLRGESLDEEEERLSLKREAQAGEDRRVREDLTEAEAGLQESRLRMERARNRQEELQRTVEALTGSTELLRSGLRERGQELAALREQAASARVARTAIESELRHHRQAMEELGARQEAQSAERVEWEARRAEARQRIETDGKALSDRMADRILAEGGVASTAAAVEERRQELEGLESSVGEARQVLEAARGRLHQVALEEERLAGDRRNLESRVAERGWSGIAVAVAELTEEDRARDRQEVESELAEWKQKRDRIGPVNLMAMEQFQELEERYTFITGQRKDLEESIRSLKETIARINRQSRERFLNAYENIRRNFSELYKVLFRGGRADLKLTQEVEGESDILEAGLEISAQPPGKRLQSISLLSGGEKALTALALLFAIFRYSPSPFCLLDEVDAALDELNVSRFVSLLKEMAAETQFIVITHSRRTMEEANMLYGVTMEEPGVSRTVSVVMGTPEDRREAARSLPETLAARHQGSPALRPPRPGRGAVPEA